jgi:hypothetical protein
MFVAASSLLYLLDLYVVNLFPADVWSKFTPTVIAANLLIYFAVLSYQFLSVAIELFGLARPDLHLKWLDRQLEKIERDEKLLP